MQTTQVLITPHITVPSDDYALLDTGDGQKLEQYGDFLLARPDPQVIWGKEQPALWVRADARFKRAGKEGVWEKGEHMPKEWTMRYGGSTFVVRPTSFKHTGVFPEQKVHWEYIAAQVRAARLASHSKVYKVLNLFAYTGGATLAAAAAGAEVTHVDASKVANAWARENATASGLASAPIRYITDDVVQFVKREIRRGNTYHAIVMDPPSFGRGTKGELWKIETDLAALVALCAQLLAPDASFVLMSGYAAGYSPLGFANVMRVIVQERGGSITCGELGIKETRSERVLPTGMYAVWERR